MKNKLLFLFLLLGSFSSYCEVKEIRKIKTFFKMLSFDLEHSQLVEKKIFNNQWYGSSENPREIIFYNDDGSSTCLHFRKNKITVYKIKGKSATCVTDNGYSMSFVNYSYRGISDSSQNNLNLFALEINALSKFFFIPLLNIDMSDRTYKKWSTSAGDRIIPGVKFLE